MVEERLDIGKEARNITRYIMISKSITETHGRWIFRPFWFSITSTLRPQVKIMMYSIFTPF